MADFSGHIGKRVWVGGSGQVTTVSGSWSSGGFASGDIGQVLGTAVNSGAVAFCVGFTLLSGGPLGIVPGTII